MRKTAVIGAVLMVFGLAACGEDPYEPTTGDMHDFVVAIQRTDHELGGGMWTEQAEANVRAADPADSQITGLVDIGLGNCEELREDPADELARDIALTESFNSDLNVHALDFYRFAMVHLCPDAEDEFNEVAELMP
ncbi:MAG: hypothetical protein ACTHYM_14035 [Actinomycetaceae bacterium]